MADMCLAHLSLYCAIRGSESGRNFKQLTASERHHIKLIYILKLHAAIVQADECCWNVTECERENDFRPVTVELVQGSDCMFVLGPVPIQIINIMLTL